MGGILWRKNDFECPVEFNTQSGSRSNKWFTNYLAITVGSDSVTAFSLKVTIKNFMYCFLEITFVVAKSL
jgi:hypothetical protein